MLSLRLSCSDTFAAIAWSMIVSSASVEVAVGEEGGVTNGITVSRGEFARKRKIERNVLARN